MEENNQFNSKIRSAFRFRMYLLSKLPAAFFSGIRLLEINSKKCVTSVPFKWLTKNPFKSTYFASLAMAAEMSTGALAMSHVYNRKSSISMLLVTMQSHFYKKATGTTYFTCEDGPLLEYEIEETAHATEGNSVIVKSTGRNKEGEMIAEFFFTWSFKVRNKTY